MSYDYNIDKHLHFIYTPLICILTKLFRKISRHFGFHFTLKWNGLTSNHRVNLYRIKTYWIQIVIVKSINTYTYIKQRKIQASHARSHKRLVSKNSIPMSLSNSRTINYKYRLHIHQFRKRI